MATFRLGTPALLAGLAVVLLASLSDYGLNTGLNSDWNEGFLHPLEGWDHLLTMITVGIWAAQLRGHAIWLLPLAFVGVMSAGGLAGAAGLAIPSVEGLILISCAVFGLLIVCRMRFSTQINVMIVAFFAFFHGFAHGQEISASASLMSYTFGFVLATLLLHGAGIIVAKLVVLCTACIVAMFVSGLAGANPGGLPLSGIGKTDRLEQTGNRLACLYFSPFGAHCRFDQNNSINGYTSTLIHSEPNGIARNNLSGGNASTPQTQTSKLAPYQLSSGIASLSGLKTNCHTPYLTNNWSSFVEDDHGLPMRNGNHYPDSPNVKRMVFKHYFPDINHSPGKALLSGGTGLTSPPACNLNFARPRFYLLYPTRPDSPIEASYLRLNVAGKTIGKTAFRDLIVPTRLGIIHLIIVTETVCFSAAELAGPHYSCAFPANHSRSHPAETAFYANVHAAGTQILSNRLNPSNGELPFHFFSHNC